MKFRHTLSLLAILAIVALMPAACTEKESDLGLDLQDPATLYNGIRDTAYDITAYTVFDDSLLTSGYSAAIIGRFDSPTYGPTEAEYYTLLGLPSDGGIDFNENFHIDSIILNYRVEQFYPSSSDTSNSYNLHFEIRQTSEQLMSDSAYYAFSTLEANGPVLYDATRTYSERDTALRFKLNDNAKNLFTRADNQEEFESQIKGLRIKILSGSDEAAVSINLAAISTKLSIYYRYGEDTSTYAEFVAGIFPDNTYVGHFNHFSHNYSSTPLRTFQTNPLDTLKTGQKLYLTPMGGTNIFLDMNQFLSKFRTDHPYAVIHYAELILPLANDAESNHPDMIYAYRKAASGYAAPIADLLDADISTTGFDGKYHADRNCYRLRISRHVQQLLRAENDYGTLLVLNKRRTSPLSTIINSTRTAGCTDPVRIEFVYTEINQE